jgi:hypothetical protein
MCVCVMPTIKIEISQAQNDTFSLIARRLYEEGVLKEPNIESLVLNTLQIVIKEYSSDPQSLVKYFKKRKSEDDE